MSYKLMLFLVSVSVSCSVGNEFIKQPKEKKFYPSCQQSREMKAELIRVSNSLQVPLHRLNGFCIELSRLAIKDICSDIDGDKECFLQRATKGERADLYAKEMKIKQKLEDITKKLSDCLDQLEQLAHV